jgi:hypothetical protein
MPDLTVLPEPSGAMTTCSGCCPFAAQADIKAVTTIIRARIVSSDSVCLKRGRARGVLDNLRFIFFFLCRVARRSFSVGAIVFA